jgi:soluble lytic murein transglycosylase-like protein
VTGRVLVLAAAALTSLSGATRLVDAAPARPHPARQSVPFARACNVSTAYGRTFRAAARETGFPVALLVAVAWEESRMKPNARSNAGARGLLQLMPQTARMLGTSPDDPRASIRAGARYLSQLLKRFGGDLELALAAYNAGPTAVERTGRAPTLATLRYAKNVEARAVELASC